MKSASSHTGDSIAADSTSSSDDDEGSSSSCAIVAEAPPQNISDDPINNAAASSGSSVQFVAVDNEPAVAPPATVFSKFLIFTPKAANPNKVMQSPPFSERPVGSGSNSNTSSAKKTPSAPPKKRRKLSLQAKKILEEEKAKKLAEKERLAAEKDRKKQENESKKREKEEKRLKEEAEKKQKEEERLRKLQEKEDAARQKEEAKKRLEEERLQKQKEKDDAQKKKDEEKEKKRKEKEEQERRRQEELDKEAEQKRKTSNSFISYFKKVPVTQPARQASPAALSRPNTPLYSAFKQFEVRPNQRLAPLVRISVAEQSNSKARLDRALGEVSNLLKSQLCIEEHRKHQRKWRTNAKTYPWTPSSKRTDPEDDDVIIFEGSESSTGASEPPQTLKHKLLQFAEDIRPPYFGTWRKKSKKITGRRFTARDDAIFDYDYDSEADWEEVEDGEDIGSSSDEQEKEKEDEEGAGSGEEEGFIVPHGYLSADEEEEDGDGAGDNNGANDENRGPCDLKLRCKVEDNYECGLKKLSKKLKQICFGPEEVDSGQILPFNVSKLMPIYFEYAADPISISVNIADQPQQPTTPAVAMASPGSLPNSAQRGRPSIGKGGPFPESATAAFISYVHGNPNAESRICDGFSERWAKREPPEIPIWKASLRRTLYAMAEYKVDTARFKDKCWYIKDEILNKHSLQHLPVPNPDGIQERNEQRLLAAQKRKEARAANVANLVVQVASAVAMEVAPSTAIDKPEVAQAAPANVATI